MSPEQNRADPGLSLPTVLRNFLLASAVLVAVCGFTEVFCRLVLHLHYPFDFPILNPGSITEDLTALTPHFEHLHHLEFFDVANNNLFMYPVPVALPYAFFLFFPHAARPLFYSFAALVIGVAGTLLTRALVRRGVKKNTAAFFVIACFLLSYPFWFVLKQGNMELVVFALLALGVWAVFHEHDTAAAVCFGIAGSMKLFPLIFLSLLLSRRRYREIPTGLLAAAGATLFSLWMIYPSVPYSWHKNKEAVSGFRDFYLTGYRDEHAFDHSLWASLKDVFPHTQTQAQLSHLLTVYTASIAVIGIGLYFWRIRRLPLPNQVLCLTVAAVLFMPASIDYTLIHLYIPWALLVLAALGTSDTLGTLNTAHTRVNLPTLGIAFACFTLLFSPLSEIIYHGITVEARIKTLVLLALFAIALSHPLVLHSESGDSMA